jgi:hypothetical protein
MLLLLAALLLCLPAQAQARGLSVGFFDNVFGSPTDGPAWLDRARDSGSEILRVGVSWSGIAPTKPAQQTNHLDPAYRWQPLDDAVALAASRGQQVILSIDGAAPWAEGARRPRSVRETTWKPDPAALGRFARALTTRYRGRARAIQVWNEPNLRLYLAPQWDKKKRPVGAQRYRRMINSVYKNVKAVAPEMLVATGGTSPYGDPQRGGRRVMPVRFWREVFKGKTYFDVLAHHPYGVGSPRRKALNADDASIPDIRKLTRLVKRSRNVLPRRAKRFWVTEMSWDSSPPDPRGVPELMHARWLSDAFFVLWKQRVEVITWFQIRDQPASSAEEFAASNQSGVFLRSGRPKLAARAFSFPFACERAGNRTRIWMKAPARGAVTIQRNGRVVATVTAGRDRVASRVVSAKPPLVAAQGGRSSVSCAYISAR